MYVRMSTEHQQYSTENQADVIREYAARRGFEIVRTFTDAGKSGLRLEGRDGSKEMIEDVRDGGADFQAILVYDVSRWGRFQDADESAYYEYICKRAGITVHYCAEQFENDGSIASNIVKTVKRAMAGEYSRELSTKVFQGQCRLIELGYRQGGPAGFGLRRMLIDETGQSKGELKIGEKKSIQTDRVILVPGPESEVTLVRRVYQLFLGDRRTEREIARTLNGEGVLSDRGHPWTRGTIRELLTNEKYIGQNVFNRISFKLKKKRVRNPEEMWVRDAEAFEPLVDQADFHTVRGIILGRHRRFSDDEMLERLKGIFEEHGRVSGVLIDETRRHALVRRVQESLRQPRPRLPDDRVLPVARLRVCRGEPAAPAAPPRARQRRRRSLETAGAHVERDADTDLLTINDQFRVSIVLSRYEMATSGSPRWTIRFDRSLEPDLTIAVRMDSTNAVPLDYYLLPSLDVRAARLRVGQENFFGIDAYRHESLSYFFGMAEQVTIEVAV